MMGIFSVEKSEYGLIAGEGRVGLERGESIEQRLLPAPGLLGDCISDIANFGKASSHGLVICIQALDRSMSEDVNTVGYCSAFKSFHNLSVYISDF